MKTKIIRFLNYKTILVITLVFVSFFIYKNRYLVLDDVRTNGIISLIAYVVKNLFNVLVSFVVIIMTIKLVKPHSNLAIYNYKKITIKKNHVFQLLLIILFLTPISLQHLIKSTEFTGISFEYSLLEKLYFFEITIFLISLISTVSSYLLIKRIYGESLISEYHQLLKRLISRIKTKKTSPKEKESNFKTDTLIFDNKIKLFISKINEERICFYNAQETESIIEDKKGHCPPVLIF